MITKHTDNVRLRVHLTQDNLDWMKTKDLTASKIVNALIYRARKAEEKNEQTRNTYSIPN